jgi:DNA polymerase-3 subunit delta'
MPTRTLAGLLGQDDVSVYLRRIVASGRYGNAYLFHGPAGVGKGTAALAFARAALCDHVPGAAPVTTRTLEATPSLFGDAVAIPSPASELPLDPPGDDACGVCPACQKVAGLMHPDMHFLFPFSGEEKQMESLDSAYHETLQSLRDDPLHHFQYDKAASIRISQTRELTKSLAYRPYEASRRLVVVRDCDRMREDQFSTLLKSIEEPGARTVWVLTTSRLSRVPATIRSRCQRVRFSPLSEALIRDTLIEDAHVEPDEARMVAALSGGSLARAIATRDEDPRKQRDAAILLLQPALKGDAATLWEACRAVMHFGRTGREALRRMIEYHELWLRDVLRARYGAADDTFVNFDRVAQIRELAAHVDAREIRRRLTVLEEALRSIDGNITADLTLFSALARVGGRRLGEGAWPAHTAGRWDY